MRLALGPFAALLLLVWASTGLAAGAPIASATKEQWSAAQKTFKVGDDLYDAGRFAEAITAYRASYEIVASPNSRLMIARALREQGLLAEAHVEFEATLSEAQAGLASDPKYESTVTAAETEKAALEPKLARLRLKLVGNPELTSLTVNERQLAQDDVSGPVFVTPGSISVVAKSGDGRQARAEASVAAGEETELVLEFPAPAAPQTAPPPPAPVQAASPSVPLKTLSYVAGGVGVAGLVAFGVFGVLNNGKHGDLEDSCPDGRCAPGRQDDIDAGRRYQLLANVGLAVGVVGLGAGVTLFVLSSRSERRTGWSLGVRGDSVQLKGRF
jgi:hypothetical protein